MLCKKPYSKRYQTFGCGQCMPCRFNRRRLWTHRMMLEALAHADASFVTLTYDEENVPADGSVRVDELQRYLKRLRKNVGRPVRFYGVGEYGDLSNRPHYHLALFGLGLSDAETIDGAWSRGFCYVGDLTLASASYIAGYVTKKLTDKNDSRLNGRNPEFARMSLRPGIGAISLSPLTSALDSTAGWKEIVRADDVPGVLRHGASTYPLGRYLRSRLRTEMGLDEKQTQRASDIRQAEMLAVYRSYLSDQEKLSPYKAFLGKERYDQASRQRTLQQLNRHRIRMSGKGKSI